MGDPNKINYVLDGSNIALTNLLTNSGLNVLHGSDSVSLIDETSKIQNPDFASPTGWTLDTNWSVSGGILNAVNATPSQVARQKIVGLTPYGTYNIGINSLSGVDTYYLGLTGHDNFEILSGNSTAAFTDFYATANAAGELTFTVKSPDPSLSRTFDNVTLSRLDPIMASGGFLGPVGWHRAGGNTPQITVSGDLNVMHNNSISSLQLIMNGANDNVNGLYYDISSRNFRRKLTFGCFVLQDTASSVEVGFSDTTKTTHSSISSTITGTTSSNYVWLEHTIDNSAGTYTNVSIRTPLNTTAYITQPMLVFGDSIGTGNYSRPAREWISFGDGNSNVVKWTHAGNTWGNGRTDNTKNLPQISSVVIPGNICEASIYLSFNNLIGGGAFLDASGGYVQGVGYKATSFTVYGQQASRVYSGIGLIKTLGSSVAMVAPINSSNSITMRMIGVCVIY